MSNLNEKDCEKPIEIINSNLKFEKKNESIKESIDLIEYMENKKIKIKEETKELLVDYINSNDFTEDTAEIIEEKSEKNFNNFINQYKEKLNDKLIEIYENNKDNDLLINQMKDKMKKLNINPNNKVLTPKQKDQKDTSMKALNNLKKMAESSEGLSDNILIKLSQNLKKIEPKETKSKEFQKLLKKQSINIIYSEIYNHKDKKIPDEIINSLSENIQIKKPKRVLESISKVADNQSLPKQTIFNLTNIINDNKNNFYDDLNNDNKSESSEISDLSDASDYLDEDTKYKMVYNILEKRQDDLGEIEKKIFNLEKNTQNIIKNHENEGEILNSLNNINNLINEGNINNNIQKVMSKILQK